MGKSPVFDRLVNELTSQERREMLQHIHRSIPPVSELLAPLDDGDLDLPLQQHFEKFSFFRRLLLLLKAFFTASGLEYQVRRQLLKDLGRRSEAVYPEFTDIRRGVWKTRFRTELVSLREGAVAIASLLSGPLGADRMEFVALLLGLALPDLEERLFRDTDPVRVLDEFPELSERELKAELERRMEDCFTSMSVEDRACMYGEFKLLNALKALCGYPFHRLLAQFRPMQPNAGTYTGEVRIPEGDDEFECTFFELKSFLPELASILLSLRSSSSSVLVDALVLQYLGGEGGEAGSPGPDAGVSAVGGDTDKKPEGEPAESAFTRKIDAAFARIGSFVRDVPIIDFIRIAHEDLSYRPEPVGGGEDWFVVYRQYWKDMLSSRITAFLRDRRRREVFASARQFLGNKDIPGPSFYTEETARCEVRYGLCLSFISSFCERIFYPRMNRYLKTILIDGEFYKDDNRVEFTDAYNALLSIQDRIEAFDRSFAPDGENGRELERARHELIASVQRDKKVQAILTGGRRDAERLVDFAEAAFASLIRILDGILNGQAGGRYDTLSNLGYMGGKNSRDFFRHLERVQRETTEAEGILRSLHELDRLP